jgi:hypothetical protein
LGFLAIKYNKAVVIGIETTGEQQLIKQIDTDSDLFLNLFYFGDA